MAIKINDIKRDIIEKSVNGTKITFEIRDGLIYESSQEEPYQYLTSIDIPIIELFISGQIRRTSQGLEYPDYISVMDKEYIEANFDEYTRKIAEFREGVRVFE